MERLLRVDMTRLSVHDAPYPEAWRTLGGRALSAKILLDEVDPRCDPLGADNTLVFAPGCLTGSGAATSGRMSVGAKSPLTHGIKEANVGGQAGQQLARLGYRAVIVEGAPPAPGGPYALRISPAGAVLDPCPELAGLRTYAASEALAKTESARAAFVLCGPAGERRCLGASVAVTDKDDRRPTRHAARGGLGAVMGAKGLKAIVVDDGGAPLRAPRRPEPFKALVRDIAKAHRAGPQPLARGTATAVPLANMMNTLPTRNRRMMRFDHMAGLDGARIIEAYATRGGAMHGCLSGCIVKCSNVVHDLEGRHVTSALEFETLALLGSNCEIKTFDEVAVLDRLCDELGLDTIEMGGALAIAMDAGAVPYGDAAAAAAVLEGIERGDELALAVADGVVATARRFGVSRVPAVKGQGLPAWEPRTFKATGVTYATSPMGADHTAGLVIRPAKDLARASQDAQVVNAVCDATGLCQFMQPSMEEMRQLLNHMFGVDHSEDDIVDYGWQCLTDEWAFNRGAGFGDEDDRLPEWMGREAIPTSGGVFDVAETEMKRVYTKLPPNPKMMRLRAAG